MSVEYKAVSWSNEPIVVEKLQQMASNDEAIFQMKPSAVLKHNGATRSRGTKILAGSQLFSPSNTTSTTHSVYFGNYFSSGCYPIVMADVYGYPRRKIGVAVNGLGSAKLPDHRGFTSYVWVLSTVSGITLSYPYYISYIAVGW